MSVQLAPESPGLRESVVGKVKDGDSKLDTADYDRIIGEALRRYSKHRPAVAVEDISGNGAGDCALPTAWVDEFSSIKSIEYPVGSKPACYLEKDEYEEYQSPDGKKLRLLTVSPAANEQLRVSLTILRTDTTIPEGDVDAVCNLAAALCLEELANTAVQTGDSTIAADVVNYRSKSSEYASRAKRYMQLYKDHMGLKDDDITPPASAVVDLSENYPGGGDRLTHSRLARRRR